VTHWGMSAKVGPVSYKTGEDNPFLGREIHQARPFSEHTQELIDEEVGRILLEADQKAEQLLRERRTELEKVTRSLLEKEELSEAEIADLIGPSTHTRNLEKSGRSKPEPLVKSEVVGTTPSASSEPVVSREDKQV